MHLPFSFIQMLSFGDDGVSLPTLQMNPKKFGFLVRYMYKKG